jgi:hypothetical protein
MRREIVFEFRGHVGVFAVMVKDCPCKNRPKYDEEHSLCCAGMMAGNREFIRENKTMWVIEPDYPNVPMCPHLKSLDGAVIEDPKDDTMYTEPTAVTCAFGEEA